MGAKPPSTGSGAPPMSSQSRISAWFVGLVVLAGTVFLLEYAVFFTSSGHDDEAAPGISGENWRLSHPVLPRSPRQDDDGLRAEVPPPEVPSVAAAAAAVAQQQLKQEEEEEEEMGRRRKKQLAVVVPAHGGDLQKALTSLKNWPTNCHPSTLANADLVLYYAGGAEDNAAAVLPALAETGGRCFANTRLVLANLSEEVCSFSASM